MAGITVALAVFLVAIFFVTGADAASIVMGMLSQNGVEEPRRWLVIFWGVATGAVAAVLLWAGGLAALQTLVILVAAPFMLVLIGMCVSLMKSLRARDVRGHAALAGHGERSSTRSASRTVPDEPPPRQPGVGRPTERLTGTGSRGPH